MTDASNACEALFAALRVKYPSSMNTASRNPEHPTLYWQSAKTYLVMELKIFTKLSVAITAASLDKSALPVEESALNRYEVPRVAIQCMLEIAMTKINAQPSLLK